MKKALKKKIAAKTSPAKAGASAKTGAPSLHIVLGSGLATAFDEVSPGNDWREAGSLSFSKLKSISGATAPGHPGVFRYFKHLPSGKVLCFQVGRLHGYEGLDPRDVIRPVMHSRLQGCERFVLTNAAGSLRTDFRTGSVMIIRDHVNMTGRNPLYGPNPKRPDGKPWGPRFPDMSQTYDRAMRERLRLFCEMSDLSVNEGTYLGLSGPTYETPAEVRLFAQWGMSAVGMSTVWESIALKHSGAKLCGLSFMSNLAAGLGGETLHHEDVEKEGRRIAGRLLRMLFGFAAADFEDHA